MGVGEKASDRRKEKEEALAVGRWNFPGEQGKWERDGADNLAGMGGLEVGGVGNGEEIGG